MECQPTPAPAEGLATTPAPPSPPPDPAPGRRPIASSRRWARRLPLALGLVAVAAVALSGVWRHLSLQELRDRRVELQAFVLRHPVLSLEVYGGGYAVLIALSLPGALVMSLAGGYLFGTLTGGATAIVGETIGAAAMFLAARSAFGAALADRLFHKGGMGRRMVAAVEDNPFTGLLMLRLIPAVPFTLVNLAAGVVRMRLSTYVVATVIGIAPSTFIYAGIGQGLVVALNRNGVPKLSSVVRPDVYLPLIALAAMGIGAFWLQARRKRRPTLPP